MPFELIILTGNHQDVRTHYSWGLHQHAIIWCNTGYLYFAGCWPCRTWWRKRLWQQFFHFTSCKLFLSQLGTSEEHQKALGSGEMVGQKSKNRSFRNDSGASWWKRIVYFVEIALQLQSPAPTRRLGEIFL